ncbi:Lrp/AsnC family transcriptional regulator, regulator for asnA, asnC and gidA [Desulfotomaculum arcticum]|uniref:Lrp/AsnC family transcriptional regulator, regulator for asnA, asnC and gidA n=1 Tax=Desulfotruncus arcticus DSM 17038 TaxID=1121424 RepID=A0A1I2RMJ4_9FIRM|nr:Lrp/AsnC family transcriptional regulator [Desulfotruncus arcticus]SFG40699.1 Lrp/AsnC family transcriptional regulator, regulator for asnA, asnC and gidA [Desulfotomaculum arcticum] [Desulfotruncus arcticus DSM 17038]
MQPLDDMDLTIMKTLQENARSSYQDIANKIGVSRVTVHERIRKLIESGIIEGFHARVNARRIGYPVTAIVGLNTIQGSESYRTIEELRQLPEVEEVHVVTGRYDYLVKVRAMDNGDLQRILFNKIDQVYGFQRAETMVVLSSAVEKCGIDMRRVINDSQDGLGEGRNSVNNK